MTDSQHPQPPVYLIVLDHVLVAHDISQAVLQQVPDARVLLARTPPEALRLLDRSPPPCLAIVDHDPRTFAASALGSAVIAGNAAVVLMGDAAEDHARASPWPVLIRPFTSATLQRHLTGAGRVCRTAAGA